MLNTLAGLFYILTQIIDSKFIPNWGSKEQSKCLSNNITQKKSK